MMGLENEKSCWKIFKNKSSLLIGHILSFFANFYPQINGIPKIILNQIIVILYVLDTFEFSVLNWISSFLTKEPKEAEMENSQNVEKEKKSIKEEESNTLTVQEIKDFTSKFKISIVDGENRPFLSTLKNEINKKGI